MYRYAVINKESLKVINMVLWDGEAQWSPPEGCFVVRSDSAGVGSTYHPESQTFTLDFEQE